MYKTPIQVEPAQNPNPLKDYTSLVPLYSTVLGITSIRGFSGEVKETLELLERQYLVIEEVTPPEDTAPDPDATLAIRKKSRPVLDSGPKSLQKTQENFVQRIVDVGLAMALKILRGNLPTNTGLSDIALGQLLGMMKEIADHKTMAMNAGQKTQYVSLLQEHHQKKEEARKKIHEEVRPKIQGLEKVQKSMESHATLVEEKRRSRVMHPLDPKLLQYREYVEKLLIICYQTVVHWKMFQDIGVKAPIEQIMDSIIDHAIMGQQLSLILPPLFASLQGASAVGSIAVGSITDAINGVQEAQAMITQETVKTQDALDIGEFLFKGLQLPGSLEEIYNMFHTVANYLVDMKKDTLLQDDGSEIEKQWFALWMLKRIENVAKTGEKKEDVSRSLAVQLAASDAAHLINALAYAELKNMVNATACCMAACSREQNRRVAEREKALQEEKKAMNALKKQASDLTNELAGIVGIVKSRSSGDLHDASEPSHPSSPPPSSPTPSRTPVLGTRPRTQSANGSAPGSPVLGSSPPRQRVGSFLQRFQSKGSKESMQDVSEESSQATSGATRRPSFVQNLLEHLPFSHDTATFHTKAEGSAEAPQGGLKKEKSPSMPSLSFEEKLAREKASMESSQTSSR